jgi:hypothetical protein
LWTKEAESTEMTDSTSVAMDTAVVAETQNIWCRQQMQISTLVTAVTAAGLVENFK